jgi:hypothetical protein
MIIVLKNNLHLKEVRLHTTGTEILKTKKKPFLNLIGFISIVFISGFN